MRTLDIKITKSLQKFFITENKEESEESKEHPFLLSLVHAINDLYSPYIILSVIYNFCTVYDCLKVIIPFDTADAIFIIFVNFLSFVFPNSSLFSLKDFILFMFTLLSDNSTKNLTMYSCSDKISFIYIGKT